MTITEAYYLTEGIAVAFFAIMAIQNLRVREVRLRTILGWILLYWAAQHLMSIFLLPEHLYIRHYSTIINTIDMTAEPTCCFLLIELCKPGWLTWRKVVVHELPFVALGAAFMLTQSYFWYNTLLAFFVLYGCGTFVAILICIPRYNRFLREHYSYDENVNLRWLYITLATFFILMFVYAIIGNSNTIIGDIVYMFGSVLGWAWINFCISKQDSVLQELEATKKEKQTKGTASASEQMADDVLTRVIEARFVNQKQFLNPKLKLGDMAVIVGTNRTYLSRHLNDVLHTTFYDYVNGLRLDYAMQLMKQTDYSITAIASMSGFNCYSTFRRIFIAKYGKSPTAFGGKA